MARNDDGGVGRAATFIASDALAARQWEIELASEQLRGGATAWLTPPVVTYRNWLEQWWSSSPTARPPPLTPVQTAALWRRIVVDSEHSRLLIAPEGAARWAADAWTLLRQWRIDPNELRADAHQPDFRALLAWCRTYRGELARHDWIDGADLEQRLVGEPLPAGDLVLADLDDPTPARTALLERFERSGRRVERRAAPTFAGSHRSVQLADSAAELQVGLDWLKRMLAKAPDARVALVVAGLGERRIEMERALATAFPPGASTPIWHGGARPIARPAIGAALLGLALCTPRATFTTFSRWLRSTFYGTSEPVERTARALLEGRLRDDLRAQLPFAEAFGRFGLAAWLEREAPRTAGALSGALTEARALQTATPSRWVQAWQRVLTTLEWSGATAAADDPDVLGWHAALDDFARLTPIVGELTGEEALAELERVLDKPTAAPVPITGLHVLESIDDVGPGYAAVWATGFTDAFWPEPARANPLLPRALQRAHNMPYSSPREARDRCARRVARLVARAPALVVSWPARLFDYETEPSPALAAWPALEPGSVAPIATRPLGHARGRETVDDAPPPFTGSELPGGAGMLSKQARCPLRAFCDYRLGARGLEPLQLGLSSRHRGKVTHAAVELLLGTKPSREELSAARARIPTAVERALTELFRDTRRPLEALFDLERERLEAALGALLVEDGKRGAFRVAAVEEKQAVRIGRWTTNVRLDRADRLLDGTLAIIDYKTGKNANTADWVRERISDAQVPIYAIAATEPVSGTVVARLHNVSARYVGFWQGDSFPGRPRPLPDDRTWAQQLAEWRRQVEQLAAEFAAGDTRILLDREEDAREDYAPLSRIAEQLALLNGSLSRW